MARGGIEGTPIPPGVMARLSAGVGAARQAFSDVWFGPGKPLEPAVPAVLPPRIWEYPPGYNLGAQAPRSYQGVTFQMLRALADNHPILRRAIETAKDKIVQLPWTVRPRQMPGETVAQAKKRNADPRIKELRRFLLKPDGVLTWKVWLRQLLEEVFVTDATTIYPVPSLGDTILSLQILDGATIRPLLNEEGMISGYQQWLYGVPGKQMSDASREEPKEYGPEELLYLPQNPRVNKVFGFSPVEQILLLTNIALRRLGTQLAFYTKGNIPEGFATAPEKWSMEQIQKWQSSFDSYMQGNPDARSGMVLLPFGVTPTFPKLAAQKDEFDDYLNSLVCWAIGVSRTQIVKQMNRASSEQGHEQAEEEGLVPIVSKLEDMLNLVLAYVFDYDDIEIAAETQRDVDPLKHAQIHDLKIRNGSLSIDESREDDGREPIGMGPGIITLNGFVPFPPGGSAEMLVTQEADKKQEQKLLTAGNGNGGGPSEDQVKAARDVLFRKRAADREKWYARQ